jgi:mono/diheme cytochrome c family protein
MPARELQRAIALGVLLLATGGCERGMRDMYAQPRPHADASSERFADGREARPPPPGSIVRSHGTRAAAASGRAGEPTPVLAGRALLERGRERYDIYCAPCHAASGAGDGMVVRRGFPRPPDLADARIRALADAQFDAVIVHGQGTMRGFGARIDADDRRAIIAYARALQLSQHAPVVDLPADVRARLQEAR